MARYRVYFEGASGSVWVEADSPEEAGVAAVDVISEGVEGVLQFDVSTVDRRGELAGVIE